MERKVFFKTEEIVKKTKVGWIEMNLEYSQLLHNTWRFVAQLNGVASRDFLLWVISKVDENNMFTYNRSMYMQFMADLQIVPHGRLYEENTIHLALKEFLDKQIATKVSRGLYRINPAIFYPQPVQDAMPGTTEKQFDQTSVLGEEEELLPEAEEEKIVELDPTPDMEKPMFIGGSLFSFDSFVG